MESMKWYEVVVEGIGIHYDIYWVEGTSPHEALEIYCKHTGELQRARMEAISTLSFDTAMELANEWLYNKIVNIHEIGYVVWDDAENRITEIKSG